MIRNFYLLNDMKIHEDTLDYAFSKTLNAKKISISYL